MLSGNRQQTIQSDDHKYEMTASMKIVLLRRADASMPDPAFQGMAMIRGFQSKVPEISLKKKESMRKQN
jgi:hypothetical protein